MLSLIVLKNVLVKKCTFEVIKSRFKISQKKRDLFITPPDLPTVLQISPGTNGVSENLFRPECCN